MIIPVRCFTCGKVIGSKWKRYEELVLENRIKQGKGAKEDSVLDIVYLSEYKSAEAGGPSSTSRL